MGKYIAGIAVVISMLFAAAYVLSAKPTPSKDTLVWDDTDNDPSIVAGYYMYYALESEAAPRQYGDTRREDLGKPVVTPAAPRLTSSIKSVLPQAKGAMCFRLTAYDALKNESPFSNEACGFQGMGNPKNLGLN
jgi:hypothetical protein